MGLLKDGKWCTDWYDTESNDGEFVRQESSFRNMVGDSKHPAEENRYHLFVSLACPWAHRTLIFRSLKKLEHIIGVTVVKPEMLEHGWELDDEASIALGYDPSPVQGIQYLYQLYTTVDENFNGRVTVPVLWDKRSKTIVNNESSEVIRILNNAFDKFTDVHTDYYPSALHAEIDSVNALVYDNVNNGVYKTGFATTQKAYEKAYHCLFDALDTIEGKLGSQRYLAGNEITEADWRLFTTLIRFDAVYYGHFKTNRQRVEDFPALSNYLRELYQMDGIAKTVNFDHIKTHYFYSHDAINPTRVVPLGPVIDYSRPHNRS